METTYITDINALDSPMRVYTLTRNVLENYTKKFKVVSDDERLLEYAKDKSLSAYSDCFILYAIAYMGASTPESIMEFLHGFGARYPSLSVLREKEQIKARLRALRNLGLIFLFSYTVDAVNETSKILDKQDISIYTLTETGFHLVKQRLQLPSLPANYGFQYKAFEEIVGWAASAHVGARLLRKSYFYELTERRFGTKKLSAFLPFEMKAKVGTDIYYVGFLNIFLHKNAFFQDEKMYKERCFYKVEVLKNYLYGRTMKGTACMIVVVESKDDLYEFSKYVKGTTYLEENLYRIFFTGEGLLRENSNAQYGFLKMQLTDENEDGFCFVSAHPVFVTENGD